MKHETQDPDPLKCKHLGAAYGLAEEKIKNFKQKGELKFLEQALDLYDTAHQLGHPKALLMAGLVCRQLCYSASFSKSNDKISPAQIAEINHYAAKALKYFEQASEQPISTVRLKAYEEFYLIATEQHQQAAMDYYKEKISSFGSRLSNYKQNNNYKLTRSMSLGCLTISKVDDSNNADAAQMVASRRNSIS